MVKTSDFESENSGSSPGEAANDIIGKIAEQMESIAADGVPYEVLWRVAVRILLAIREPTADMIAAGHRAYTDDDIGLSFTAMIDAALLDASASGLPDDR